MKKVFAFLFVFCFSVLQFFAESKIIVDFFGVYSESGDKNMIEMTKNLYFAQLKELDFVTVSDKTSSAFFSKEDEKLSLILKEQIPDDLAVQFFVEITSSSDNKWNTFVYINSPTQSIDDKKSIVVKKEYTSYYKILTEAKNTIESAFMQYEKVFLANNDDDFFIPNTAAKSDNHFEQNNKTENTSSVAKKTTTESIAGTWHGENFIDKIVILRGGRGFIIYKNGATMNIQVTIEKNESSESIINIVQSGKSNASFYPELPRKTALENAPNAKPLEWSLVLTDENTLQGNKKTLIEDSTSPTGATDGISEVTWIRK